MGAHRQSSPSHRPLERSYCILRSEEALREKLLPVRLPSQCRTFRANSVWELAHVVAGGVAVGLVLILLSL